ncbi:MAG: hypothetical protein AAGF23_19335, partial [Acidobacteriota bacterium]
MCPRAPLRPLIAAVAVLAAGAASAQHTVFYADFDALGRLDSPATAGPLEPSASVPTANRVWSLARLPDGTLLEVGSSVRRLDPDTLALTEITPLDVFCLDSAADGDGDVWCVFHSNLHRLDAGTYDVGLSVEHPGLRFVGIAALGPRLFGAVRLLDNGPVDDP